MRSGAGGALPAGGPVGATARAPAVGVPNPAAGLLRAGRGYELVVAERCPDDERDALAAAGDEPYGLLRPLPGSGLPPRVVSPDTALLFLTLAEPGPLPGYARAALGLDAPGTVARLILDGVLEFEYRGEWCHGGRAAALLAPAEPLAGSGRIGVLSLAALHYGQHLGNVAEEVLAQRLYGFGRHPIGPELRRLLPDDAAVTDAIGLGGTGRATQALGAAWAELPASKDGRQWRYWRPRVAGRPRPSRANVKLYISPAVETLGDALGVLAELLGAAPSATAFKVGTGLSGICRPDKIVVYFDGLDVLHATAQELAVRLRGVPAHGVPFTAAVTEDGLLSWAVDPRGTSWRFWLAGRLAEHLMQGRREPDGPPPWRYALQRLRLDGVDTDRWTRADGVVPQGAGG